MVSGGGKHTTVLSTKGQFILPKAIRERRRWSAGTRFTVEDTAEGVLLKLELVFAPTTLDAVFGCLEYQGPAKSLEDYPSSKGEASNGVPVTRHSCALASAATA